MPNETAVPREMEGKHGLHQVEYAIQLATCPDIRPSIRLIKRTRGGIRVLTQWRPERACFKENEITLALDVLVGEIMRDLVTTAGVQLALPVD